MYVFNYVQLYRPLLKQILWRQINIETAKRQGLGIDMLTQKRKAAIGTYEPSKHCKWKKKTQKITDVEISTVLIL